jgi:hypothetical protein
MEEEREEKERNERKGLGVVVIPSCSDDEQRGRHNP